MAAEADQLKERGNVAFRNGLYAQAEILYTEALGCNGKNHLIYNNRANVRIRLQKWSGTEEDCRNSIELAQQNHKAYYFLAQAQLALDRPHEALASALKAYQQINLPSPGMKTSTKDLETFSTFVLKCKKARFAARDRERLRLKGDLQAEIENLLEQERRNDLASIAARLDALELSTSRASNLSQDVQSNHDDKIAQLRTTFLLADPGSHQPREIPDYLVDVISFEPMHDPVMTNNGHSYEKSTIHEHLRRSPTDPLTREPLAIEDLRPNLALKAACDAFWDGGASEWIIDW